MQDIQERAKKTLFTIDQGSPLVVVINVFAEINSSNMFKARLSPNV